MGANRKVDKDIWEQMVNEIDQDGNGNIDYAEFKNMMQKISG